MIRLITYGEPHGSRPPSALKTKDAIHFLEIRLILQTKTARQTIMAEITLAEEIETIQENLRSLTLQIEAFEAESKTTIRIDRKDLFDKLRKSVESVEKTVQFLETGES